MNAKTALFILLPLLLMFSFQNCAYVGESDSHLISSISEDVTYSDLQSALFTPKCVACHSGGTPDGAYDLSSYSGLMSGGRVVPEDPSSSLLVDRVRDGSMPPGNPLSESEILALESWIASGAESDEASE